VDDGEHTHIWVSEKVLEMYVQKQGLLLWLSMIWPQKHHKCKLQSTVQVIFNKSCCLFPNPLLQLFKKVIDFAQLMSQYYVLPAADTAAVQNDYLTS
jgi:hypothetical protein